jgi:hypothetical protein
LSATGISTGTGKSASHSRRLDPLEVLTRSRELSKEATLPTPGALGAGDEIGLREVDPVGFIHLVDSKEHRRIDAH